MKKPTGSRYLVCCQLKKVLREAIPRISTLDEADHLQSEVFRIRDSGIFDDRTCQELLNAIDVMRQEVQHGS